VALYAAIPKASNDIVEVATSTALKTLLQVAPPAGLDIQVCGWSVSFDGIVVTNPPGKVQLVDVDVAASVTSLTPEEWGSTDGAAAIAVGGATATGYNATAEGSIGGSRLLDGQNVHPQSGYGVWFPERERPIVKAARFLRIRALFSVDVNCIPIIWWREPASG
jgi:hypothetical protein